MKPDAIPESPAFRAMRLELEARAEARALLRFLEARGVVIDDASRTRIRSCTEIEVIERWVDRAARIRTIEELFEQ